MISGTNSESISPTVVQFGPVGGVHYYIHLAYQEAATIKYQRIKFTSTSLDYQITNVVSSGSGYTNNTAPSISLAGNNYPVISWIGFNGQGIGKVNETTGIPGTVKKVVVRRGNNGTWGSFFKVGDNASNTNNNSITSSTEATIIAWSEGSAPNYASKWVRRTSSGYTDAHNISNNGKQNQVSNGTSLTDIKSTVKNDF